MTKAQSSPSEPVTPGKAEGADAGPTPRYPEWLRPFEEAGTSYARTVTELYKQLSERLAQMHKEYQAAAQSAWMYVDPTTFLRESSEQYNASVARILAELAAPRTSDEAFETYVAAVRDAWTGVPAGGVELDTWAAIQYCLQVGCYWRNWSLMAFGRAAAEA